jgi:2-phosphosulfolactate phosphatase
MRQLEVCFSPEIYQAYENGDASVVVIDIFRATSAMVTAFQYGVKAIIPVEHIEQALDYKKQGYLVAAERKGEVVEGFQYGNSPFHYMGPEIRNQTIVITTTNGTRAIEKARKSKEVICGSFLNLSAVVNHLLKSEYDILLLCAGWKGRFNMEDSIYAGALVHFLMKSSDDFEVSDGALAAMEFYRANASDIAGMLAQSSHRKRLAHLHLERDIDYCLHTDTSDVLPVLKGDRFENVNKKVTV